MMTSMALQSLSLPESSTVCVSLARKKKTVKSLSTAPVLRRAITKLLLTYGFKHVTMCDREGIIGKDYPNLNWMQKKMTEVTNLENASGTLADALKGADIFVGVSAPNIVTPEMVASMNKDSILLQWQIRYRKSCRTCKGSRRKSCWNRKK